MRILSLLALALAFGGTVPIALATDASVTISSPKDGDILSSKKKIKVVFKATPVDKGNHLHLFVDSQKEIMLHKFKGSYTLKPLAPGKHAICIRLADKEHAETGTQDCVMFRVE